MKTNSFQIGLVPCILLNQRYIQFEYTLNAYEFWNDWVLNPGHLFLIIFMKSSVIWVMPNCASAQVLSNFNVYLFLSFSFPPKHPLFNFMNLL